MRRILASLFLICNVTATPAAGANPQLHCIVGPAVKTYGGTKWLVHSCDDGKSLVFTAQAGPAAPFEFDLTYTGKGYDLDGRGKSQNKATDAAYADLQKLRVADILKLIQETQRVKRD
ncbi:MAG: hypothetical protein JOY77_03275 [Alphaproteobacteria bacterium]|nr:hypothetical protein [Alphaproteobacteria bacterium]MBV9061934.1 hypothetical protein [Alphaproteobacteria bacterium]